jgi:hypothetical protein
MAIEGLYERSWPVFLSLSSVALTQGTQHVLVMSLQESLAQDFDDYNCKAYLGMAFLIANGLANPIWGYIW